MAFSKTLPIAFPTAFALVRRYPFVVGAVVGAVLFTLFQVLLQIGFVKLFVSPPMPHLSVRFLALNSLQRDFNALRWPTQGALVGGLGWGLRAAWRAGDLIWVRRCAFLSLCLLAYCVFQAGRSLYGVFSRPLQPGLLAYALLYWLPFNLLLQCALALTVAGRIATKRLRTPDKR